MSNPNQLEILVDVLFGDRPESDLESVSADQRVRYDQLARLATPLREAPEIMPATLTQALRSIWPADVRKSLAVRLLGTTRGFAAARGVPATLQAEYVLDTSISLRLAATQEGDQWHIMGKVSSGEWTILLGDSETQTQKGRFEIFVAGPLPATLSGYSESERFEVELEV